MVKVTLPIISHSEYIDMMGGNICHFLLPVVFGDDMINIFARGNYFDSLGVAKKAALPFKALNSSVETATINLSPIARNRLSSRTWP